ncbi:hypothetical protein BDR04DRAFT_265827 [Suillus decipiens]|nr:hypothetical protein BDR04DRAFT_265827 [Suillus decipiens]
MCHLCKTIILIADMHWQQALVYLSCHLPRSSTHLPQDTHLSSYPLMDDNNLPRKTRCRWLKPSRSEPHLVQERGRRLTSHNPSSFLPLENRSTARLPGPIRKLFGKMTRRFSRSAQQPPNPEHTAASSQDIQVIQSTKDLTASALELNPEQASNSRIVEINPSDEVRIILIFLF